MTTSFTTVCANTLEEVHMIAGDEQTFTYNIYNSANSPFNLADSTCSVYIFKYGDPTHIIADITGEITGSPTLINQFQTTFSGSGLSGVYQQQIKIVDSYGVTHIPAQGKIVIFPSPQ